MNIIPIEQLANYSPAALRLAESEYVLGKFTEGTSAPHGQTLFLLTTYFDAFLFCYVSIEEMVERSTRGSIRKIPIFAFFKALRNIATHHCVLSGVEGRFPRPITRIVKIGEPQNAVFCVLPDKVEHIFSEILKDRPWERKTIDVARAFLAARVCEGGDILVGELMRSAIEAVRGHVA